MKSLKRIFATLFTFTFIIAFMQAPTYAGAKLPADVQEKLEGAVVLYKGSPTAYVNGSSVSIDLSNNVYPIFEKNHILLPIRFISENFGAKVGWDSETHTSSLYLENKLVQLKLNSSVMIVNNDRIELESPAQSINGRIFVPVRAVAKALGKEVFYYKGLTIIGNGKNMINTKTEMITAYRIAAMFKKPVGTNTNTYIPILMYHHFQDNPPESMYSTTVTPDEFEEHLRYFKENGYTSITFFDLYNYAKGYGELPAKPFIITMDDGYLSNYTLAYPLLKKYNTKATISIIASLTGMAPHLPHFTWEQAQEMEESGLVDIQNHSNMHENFSTLSKDEIIQSVTTAQNLIDKNLGARVIKVFTYPGGKNSTLSREVISQLGFNIQVTGLKKLATKKTDLSDVCRISVVHGLTGKDIENTIEKLK